MRVEDRLKDLGITLPEVPNPIGNFVPRVLHKGLLYMSGEGPLIDLQTSATGVVGKDVTVEQAYQHARLKGISMLSSVCRIPGSLDRVERLLSVHGMVNAVPDFRQHPKVMIGFSDLMVQLLGGNGRHAWAAVGMGSLPDGITVEVTAIFAVRP
jgi:enamine deaminase RidA (YjgF/YER057c/UK114 family)